MLAAALVVLPTVLLRDLSLLSFLSIGGIFASVALLGLVGWEGAAVTGFPHTAPPFLIPSGLPVSLGLYCFCFSGHAVFPSLIASLRNKSQVCVCVYVHTHTHVCRGCCCCSSGRDMRIWEAALCW